MPYGGGFRALAALLLVGFIGLIALGAYGAGFAAGNGSPAFTPGNPPSWAYYGPGFGFGVGHLVGFLVTILVFIIVVRLILAVVFGGHRHHGWARHGYWRGEGDAFGTGRTSDPGSFGPGGPGPWGGWHRSDWREAGQARFDELHNRSHGYPPPAGGPASGGPATGGPAGGPAAGGPTADQPR
jgi:hypothetical protein